MGEHYLSARYAQAWWIVPRPGSDARETGWLKAGEGNRQFETSDHKARFVALPLLSPRLHENA
jgi:hypothetical protein